MNNMIEYLDNIKSKQFTLEIYNGEYLYFRMDEILEEYKINLFEEEFQLVINDKYYVFYEDYKVDEELDLLLSRNNNQCTNIYCLEE